MYKEYTQEYCDYVGKEANDLVYSTIENALGNRGLMIAKFGTVELSNYQTF